MNYYRPHPKDGKGNGFTLSVHTPGGVPTMGGTYLGWGVPPLDGGYLPWPGEYLPWPVEGTYLGWGYLPLPRVPPLAGGYLPWMGVPTLAGGTYLGWVEYPPWMGVPTLVVVGVIHLGRSSIGSTCYVAGGMPLAFTQEDCLVLVKVIRTLTGGALN